MTELVFTPAAVLDLLTQIDELKQYNIGVAENLDGTLQITVGNSIYQLSKQEITDVAVESTVMEVIEDANIDAYESMSYSGDVGLDYVESGIIKEVAKTLLVGGLVRLTNKLLNKSKKK